MARRADTTARPENAAARLRARVTKRAGPEDPGQAVRAAAPGRPAGAARTASPGGGPRRVTGRVGLRPKATSAVAPDPEADRAGPPTATAHAAGAQPPIATADPRRAVGPAGRANRGRRVLPAAATGAEVHQGRARTARARTIPATGARPCGAVSAQARTDRRAGRTADRAARPDGRPVTGQQDPRATAAATGPRGRTAPGPESTQGTATVPAVASEPGIATAPAAASEPGTATAPAAASAPRTATAAGNAQVAVVPGPVGTRHRPGRSTRRDRRFRSRSAPSSSIPRPWPNCTASRTTWPTPWPASW